MRKVFLFLVLFIPLLSLANDSVVPNKTEVIYGKYDPNFKGYTTVFVGKTIGISGKEFLSRINKHVEMFRKLMADKGLVNYIAYATDDHEAAVTQWKSEVEMKKAFDQVGGTIQADAGQFLKSVLWTELKPLPKAVNDSYFKELLKKNK